ncbi:MAG: replication initiator protein [Microvirus sp.]|nr:MAG: replication initiator protein [Microvirus sp.]
MACWSPLRAWQKDSGEIVFVERGSIRRELSLPCGQCSGCRTARSREWAVRCIHESSMHDSSYFLTLTYAPEHCPISLVYSHFQLFMKRLRKWDRSYKISLYEADCKSGSRARDPAFSPQPLRFYMCGEYGEQFSRPHYHACLFGISLPDLVVYSETGSGSTIYISKILDSLWPFGYASIGAVTFESAAYVARYVMKKVTGPRAADHYRRCIVETGEMVDVVPEFTRMSLKPGIGASWIAKYSDDVYTTDACIIKGKRVKPPRYYDKYLALSDAFAAEYLEFERYTKAMLIGPDNTPDRLRTRQIVAEARLSFSQRKL